MAVRFLQVDHHRRVWYLIFLFEFFCVILEEVWVSLSGYPKIFEEVHALHRDNNIFFYSNFSALGFVPKYQGVGWVEEAE